MWADARTYYGLRRGGAAAASSARGIIKIYIYKERGGGGGLNLEEGDEKEKKIEYCSVRVYECISTSYDRTLLR